MKKLHWCLASLVLSLGCVAPPGGSDGGTVAADGGRTGGGGGRTGGGSGGGTATGGGGGSTATPEPQWLTLSAHVAGRTGRDLRLAIQGVDRNSDTQSVWVRLMDSVGGPVIGLDLNRDGMPDSAEGSLPLESKHWAGTNLTAVAFARGLYASGVVVDQVAVRLVDAAGLTSEEQTATVVAQQVLPRGSACDVNFIENRCEPSLGCRGNPAKCDEGLAPQVTRLAFYRGANGPTILMEGTEPEDDLSTIRFQFQNAQGQPISIDSDGDGTPDLSSFDQDAMELAVDGTFFLRMQPGSDLDQQVPKLVATPVDGAGHTGTAKIAAPSNIPVRNVGQTCDARGFDVCGTNLSCSPGIPGATNKCATAAPMRTAQCTAAVVLSPTIGNEAVTYGSSEGGSLWDAPTGCSTADPTGRPEGVVVLRLASRASKVILSTIGPGTNFDTTLYVAPGCPNDMTGSLGCSDDAPMSAGASRLELNNLPAGDYLVVVDSFDLAGGAFELHATVE